MNERAAVGNLLPWEKVTLFHIMASTSVVVIKPKGHEGSRKLQGLIFKNCTKLTLKILSYLLPKPVFLFLFIFTISP